MIDVSCYSDVERSSVVTGAPDPGVSLPALARTRETIGELMSEGRRVLACSSAGGHFKQLVRLVRRIPDVADVTWVTYDSGLAADLLKASGFDAGRLVYAPYAAPRDVRNLVKDSVVVRRQLDEADHDIVVSTGAGIAVAALPLARSRGVRACYIESAARTMTPSMSGRILQRIPGIELYSQNNPYTDRWKAIGSIHDEFERGPDRDCRRIRRAVVTLGTSKKYGFRRLIERLVAILPAETEVLWQTGSTDTSGLNLDVRSSVAGPLLESAMRDADVVVAHAGLGSALTAFECGAFPILVPRSSQLGENIDDHQELTARDLAARGLALCVDADDLSMEHITEASRRTVSRVIQPPAVPL